METLRSRSSSQLMSAAIGFGRPQNLLRIVYSWPTWTPAAFPSTPLAIRSLPKEGIPWTLWSSG